MERRPGACCCSDEDVVVILHSIIQWDAGRFAALSRQTAGALLAVWPNRIFLPSSVTVGRLEYGSALWEAPCVPGRARPPANHGPRFGRAAGSCCRRLHGTIS